MLEKKRKENKITLLNRPLQGILVRPWKAKRGAEETALVLLETSKVLVNRMLEKCGQYRPF